MPQFNMHLTPEFQKSLADYMRLRHLKTKSEAIRQAVRDALERERSRARAADFKTWLGLANRAPGNPHPRFASDDDLWD